jgi:NAD(P)-dependent dehydrogenase (short-subunit alcohol dehydrogenase family)
MPYNMKGKTVLITGGCGGIGFQTALELSQAGATTVVVCREPAQCEVARESIAAEGGAESIEALSCDLASPRQIRALVDAFKSRHDRLHVLINDAATVPARRILTEDGLEMQFAVNHLAYFVLTALLLDVLKASAPARIVNVSSGLHRRAKLDFGALQAEKGYKPMAQYGLTKLLNIYFTYELARRLAGTGVTANTLSPGFTSTGLGRSYGPFSRWIMRKYGKSVAHGADTVVFLAASPEVEGVTGTYFSKRKPEKTAPGSYDAAVSARLLALSEELTRPR